MKRRLIGTLLAALSLCLIGLTPVQAALPTANIYLRSMEIWDDVTSNTGGYTRKTEQWSYNRDAGWGASHIMIFNGVATPSQQSDWDTEWELTENGTWQTAWGTDKSRTVVGGTTGYHTNQWLSYHSYPPTRWEYARLTSVPLGGLTGIGGGESWSSVFIGWTTCGGYDAWSYHTRKATPDVFISLSNAVPGKKYVVQVGTSVHWLWNPCPGYETTGGGTLIDPHVFHSDESHTPNYWLNDGTKRVNVDTNGFVTLVVPAEGLAVRLGLDQRFRSQWSWYYWESPSITVLSEVVPIGIDPETAALTSRSASIGSDNSAATVMNIDSTSGYGTYMMFQNGATNKAYLGWYAGIPGLVALNSTGANVNWSINDNGNETVRGSVAASKYLVGGASGPLLKTDAGTVQFRNNGDTAAAPINVGAINSTSINAAGGITGDSLTVTGSATAYSGYFNNITSSQSTIPYMIVGSGGPTITSGNGAPTSTPGNGSLYLRTDGTGPNLYVRQNGAWVAK